VPCATVDGSISEGLVNLIDLTISMMTKLAAVVVFAPIFLIPGVLMAGKPVTLSNYGTSFL
jgi:hypothetical protein